jgi:hypothetical protein
MVTIVSSKAVEPERIYAAHLQVRVDSPALQELTKKILTDVKQRGYNTVFINIRALPHDNEAERRSDLAQWRETVRYAQTLGLEPIFNCGMVTGIGFTWLDKKYPGILYRGQQKFVWNPLFKFSDGRSIYEGFCFARIDGLLEVYGERPAKYLHIGCDEVDTVALQQAAQKENLTAGKLLAREINRITGHLIKKNITPIMWGDMFLCKGLAKPGVVRGFPGDSRFNDSRLLLHDGAMHGDGSGWGGVNVMDGVDDIVTRDKIIIADWHYNGGTQVGEFPSVDYFKKLGFKDVWGAVWYNEMHIREFSKYAAARNCGGMIECPWGYTHDNPHLDSFFRMTLWNAIVYFKNPTVPLGVRPTIFAYGPGSGKSCLFPAGSKLTLVAKVGDNVKIASDPMFTIKEHNGSERETMIPVTIEKNGNTVLLKAAFAIPQSDAPGKAYDVKLEYMGENQLLYQGYEEALFAVDK